MTAGALRMAALGRFQVGGWADGLPGTVGRWTDSDPAGSSSVRLNKKVCLQCLESYYCLPLEVAERNTMKVNKSRREAETPPTLLQHRVDDLSVPHQLHVSHKNLLEGRDLLVKSLRCFTQRQFQWEHLQ